MYITICIGDIQIINSVWGDLYPNILLYYSGVGGAVRFLVVGTIG